MPKIDPLILQFEEWRSGVDKLATTILIKYTAKWCGPCRAIPFEKVATDLSGLGIHLIEIDIDDHFDAATYFGVSSIPSFILLVPTEAGTRKHAGPFCATNTDVLKKWIGRIRDANA